jgi:L-methionine (R)-S-oxide reductase
MDYEEISTVLRNVLAAEDTRPEKARKIAETIRRGGNYRWVGLYDVDIIKGEVRNIAWDGHGAPAYPVFPITKGITSRAIASRKTVNIGDVVSDPDYLTALDSTRSEIIVPVFDGDRVAGTIDIESERPQAFDHATEAFLEKCAGLLRPFWL